jgi:general nucleoside transport system permease protein
MVFDFVFGVLRVFLPLGLCVIAGYLSEKSGVAQVALEAKLLLGALAAASMASLSGSAPAGIGLAIFVGASIGFAHWIFSIVLRADQIIVGMCLNLLAFGVAPFTTLLLFQSTGSSPSLDAASKADFSTFLFIGIFVLIFIIYLDQKSLFGLRLKFAGENPSALASVGVNVKKIRLLALLGCGAIAGLAGSVLSLSLASSYTPMMSAGRGFIALAALIFGRWNLKNGLLAALVFALLESSQFYLQSKVDKLFLVAIQLSPYLLSFLILAIFNNKSGVPAGMGKHE